MADPVESPVLRSVWEHVTGRIAGIGLGGIAPATVVDYGYHNCADRHYAGTTTYGRDDYSVQQASDRCPGIGRYFCALDLTGDASTRTVTRRLLQASAAGDPRIRCLREWFGSLDNKTVTGRAHTSPDGAWSPVSADTSHLTHNHLSLFRCFATNMTVVDGLVDVILGVPMALDAADIAKIVAAVWAAPLTPNTTHRNKLGWEAGRSLPAKDVVYGAYVQAALANTAASAVVAEVTALHAVFDALDTDCDVDPVLLQAAVNAAVSEALGNIHITVDADDDGAPVTP